MKIIGGYLNIKSGRLKPIFTSYSITYRCNLRCSYCSTWRLKSSELNTAQALRVVDALGGSGVAIIDFSGGEPTLRNDLEILAGRVREYSCIASMNTNGYLINSYRAKLIAKVFDYVTVSLDGPPEVHDGIRGVQGVYSRSLSAIRSLRGEGVRVGVNIVVSGRNINVLPRFINDIIGDVDYLTLQPIHPSNAGSINVNKVVDLVNHLVKAKKHYPGKIPLTYSYIHGFIDYFKGKMVKICDAGKLYFAVDPSGNVLACGARGDIILGNMLSKDLGSILIEERFKVLNAINSCRGCWLTCTTGLSLTLRSSIFESLSLIKHA